MKRLIKLFVFLICVFAGMGSVFASSVSIKPSATTITRGNTITITTTVSADSGIYTIEGSMSCKGASVNGGIDLNYEDMNTASKSKSFTYVIKPTSSGTVVCSTSGVMLRELAKESNYQLSNASVSITVKDPVVIPPKEYSSDNTLTSLGVDGYNISPKFNKDTLEYALEVDESVEKIKVVAKANDNNASVSGTGDVSLTPGENVVKISVKAENGNVKVYKIVVEVKDQNPISVKVDDDDYTIVKKNNDVLEKLDYYEESSIEIDSQDVVSYENTDSGITLVMLKDSNGEVNYYTYDKGTGEYQLYRDLKIGNTSLYLLEMDNEMLPYGYQKYDLTVNEMEIDGYKLDEDSSFYLMYAMNISNGEKYLYLYDSLEGTVQRYDSEIFEQSSANFMNDILEYKNYFYIVSSILGAIIVVLLIVLIVKLVKKRRKR